MLLLFDKKEEKKKPNGKLTFYFVRMLAETNLRRTNVPASAWWTLLIDVCASERISIHAQLHERKYLAWNILCGPDADLSLRVLFPDGGGVHFLLFLRMAQSRY